LAARVLWPDQRATPLLAAALVAFNPQFLFTCGLVSNDPLLAALGAALLWRCLRLARAAEAAPLPRLIGCGLLFGLALLTKQSALLFGPLLLWAGWRAVRGSWCHFLAATLTWGLAALLVAGWWYLRNLKHYGDLFGIELFSAEFAGAPFAWSDPAAWLGGLTQLVESFWARFGWMSLFSPAWMLWPYWALIAIALFGWARAERKLPHGLWLGPLMMLVMALAWLLSFVAAAGLVAWQGRMLFPAIAAIGIFLALGVQKVKCDLLPFTFCFLPLVLSSLMPFLVIAPAYTWVALPEAQARAELGTPIEVRFAQRWERGVVLAGWRLDQPASTGTDLALTLTWQSLELIPKNWVVFAHLLDADDQIIAETNSAPCGATLPFPRWTPGDWVRDPHRMALPSSLPPGRYRLVVGLYLPESGDRMPVWAEDGSQIGDLIRLGEVVLN
ncbi:MAG: hypothetical protein HGA65_19365, partial [Oscillochloris sp.]|nr:hypothetical protein [Oscillochloris sp.]